MEKLFTLHNIGLSGILIALILAINDVFSFGMVKQIMLDNKSLYWLIIPMVLYSLQILILYFGLKETSITVLNISWNLISNILVTIMGLYFFGEKINDLKTIALIFAVVSIVLFTIDEIKNG